MGKPLILNRFLENFITKNIKFRSAVKICLHYRREIDGKAQTGSLGWENASAIWLQGKLSQPKFSMELRKWASVFTRFTFDCTISPQITCSWPPTSLVNNTFHSSFPLLPCSIQAENFSVLNFRLPRNERARIRLNIINEKFRVEINFV